MSIVVVLPIEANASLGGAEFEADLSLKVSRSAGKQAKVFLPKRVASQIAALKKAEPSPEKYVYRERGSSFIPNFHFTLSDASSGSTRWHMGEQGGAALSALFPHTIPGVSGPGVSGGVKSLAPKALAGEAIPACLGFTITMGGMMLFGAVESVGNEPPSISFNVLAAGGNVQQGQPQVIKTGNVVKVSLPNGTVVEIPPAFVKAMTRYLDVIASAG
jgi:hypothetical protein